MTAVSRLSLALNDIVTGIVTVKGTPAAVLPVGSLLMFDKTDGTYIPYANGSNAPVKIVKDEITIPAGGTILAEVIQGGNVNEDLIDLPGSMTLDTVPTFASAGAAVGAAVPGNTGSGVISAAPVVGANAKIGVYNVVCVNDTTAGSEIFSVVDPDGNRLEDAVTDVPYLNSHLGFTISATGYDPNVDDAFTVTVDNTGATKLAWSIRQYLCAIGIYCKKLVNLYE